MFLSARSVRKRSFVESGAQFSAGRRYRVPGKVYKLSAGTDRQGTCRTTRGAHTLAVPEPALAVPGSSPGPIVDQTRTDPGPLSRGHGEDVGVGFLPPNVC